MITLKEYQEKAVEGLLDDTYSLLNKQGGRHKMTFKAPTGAGKTIIMAAYLDKLCEELPDRLDISINKVSFIWIAPNQLHLQSYGSLKQYFSESRSIKAIQFEDVTDRKLKPNEVLFLNWQSINKDSNLYVRDQEQDKTLIKFVNNARIDNTEVIVILDEAHLFASKGKAAKELLDIIYGKIEIDVSATPLPPHSDYGYTIKAQKVIEAGMIKKGVLLNPRIEHSKDDERSLNEILLDIALKKRNEIKTEYLRQGVDINPLLLIQLPNDSEGESAEDIKVKEEVHSLLQKKGITINNNKLAVWLSNQKDNLDDIECFTNLTEVLLFKQAISLGWDCPRASVLLIFREIKLQSFTIQTVGRILRMPEQKHYTSAMLNVGYVYTNLSKDIIEIVKDDLDYIVFNKSKRFKHYTDVNLPASYINTRLSRNRLGSKFRKFLFESFEGNIGVTLNFELTQGETIHSYNIKKLRSHFVETDVDSIEIPVPTDVYLQGEIGLTQVDQMERFAKTKVELDVLFRQFCRNHVGGYAKVDSAPVLEMAIKMLFDDYFGFSELNCIRVILYSQNRPIFIELIDIALGNYEKWMMEKASTATRKIETNTWEVPVERIYNDLYTERKCSLNIMDCYFESKSASTPEKGFVTFLENNSDSIEWWYKNGENNKEHFSISYTDTKGLLKSFYVDFVFKLKNGSIGLFDTKTLDSDKEFCNKHNALVEYVEKNSEPARPLFGGVIIPVKDENNTIWKYSKVSIKDATQHSGWKILILNSAN